MGLPAGIAIGSGVIDAYAGWIGTVGAKIDALSSNASKNDVSQAFTRLAAVAGTSTCHLAMSEKPVFVNGVWGPYRDVLLPDYWMAEGGQSATGELLKHVTETHPAYQEAMSAVEKLNSNIYDYLNDHLRELSEKQNAPAISWLGRHLFFYGDLFGNRSPVADPDMKGSVIGLSPDKSIDGGVVLLCHYGIHRFANTPDHRGHEQERSCHQLDFHIWLSVPKRHTHVSYGNCVRHASTYSQVCSRCSRPWSRHARCEGSEHG